MTQEMMDPEIIADFIVEAKEHLETIEPTLLELEKAPKDLDLLNDIFRPMHSLKGASGFLGFQLMNSLAHRAENILDELRKGSFVVTTEIMDVILEATDALRQMIDNLEATGTEGDVSIDALVTELDALLLSGGVPSQEKSAPAKIQKAEANNIAAEGIVATENADAKEQMGNIDAWLESLRTVTPYTLVSFGEGHLRDFIEEAKENLSSLAELLLVLEKEESDDLVNDIFRLFHNLKGNSGIIGYNEINSLTHEAETLLNNVRKHEFQVSAPLIDLLLLVVDVLEALVLRIDPNNGYVIPLDISELVTKLQQVIAGEKITMPGSLQHTATVEKVAPIPPAPVAPVEGDIETFKETVSQQFTAIKTALEILSIDGENSGMADALFRSLDSIKNACSYMELEEIKTYTERTAGIVDSGRNTNLDFSMLVDLLEQEVAIIRDMIADAVEKLKTNPVGKTAKTDKALEQPINAKETTSEPATLAKAAVSNPDTSVAMKTQEVERVEKTAKKENKLAPVAEQATAKLENTTSAKSAKREEPKASSTIRVDHEKLDHLMNVIGELIINRNRFSMLARQLEHVDSEEAEVSQIAQDLSETTYAMARISDDLQATIMQVRMVPVASVFSRFPRLVRDLSRKSNKEVEFIVSGEDTELDKSVVEVIGDPLVHLIRNSVDHGIESAEDRIAAGKNLVGKVYLRAFYRGNSVAIEIEDDGKGIDPVVIREIAVSKGIISEEEAKVLDDREALELIFAPGFSSAKEITDISGRGVGMDVVRTNIKSLKGSISITSEKGKGSIFSMSLPLTLAIIDALMVDVSGERYAIPLDAVSETTKIEASRLTDMQGRKAVTLRGDVLGVVSLAEILGLPCNMAEQKVLSVVIIHDNERRLGVVVDTLHERQEIVIKPLGEYLGDIQGISGATIMGDGSVILILDPHEMYSLATKGN